MAAQQYYARRGPFEYGPKLPEDLVETDQVFRFGTGLHDERMLRLGQVAKVPVGTKLFACRVCGKEFVSDRSRDRHGVRMHEDRSDRTPRIRDDPKGLSAEQIRDEMGSTDLAASENLDPASRAEVENEKVLRDRPIHFDKTEASVKAGEGIAEVVTAAPVVEEAPAPVEEAVPEAPVEEPQEDRPPRRRR